MRVLFFGMTGLFSLIPLEALFTAGVEVVAVVLPDNRQSAAPITNVAPVVSLSPLPLVNPFVEHTIVQLAWERGVPAYEVHDLVHPATVAELAALRPEVACVACFSRRIPPGLLALPTHGFLNLHPSLLPAYRGPDPLFWVLRDGAQPGVTLHLMDAGLDTGDIVAQAPLDLPDGSDRATADRLLAERGATLLLAALCDAERGGLARHAQPPGGTPCGLPRAEHFAVSPDWPARRVFNFMRGTAEWGEPYPIVIAGERLLLGRALTFDRQLQLDRPIIRSGSDVAIQCSPGVLWAQPAYGMSR